VREEDKGQRVSAFAPVTALVNRYSIIKPPGSSKVRMICR
jgi:hypothetical protein